MIEIDATKPLTSSSGEMILNVQLSLQPKSFNTLYGESGAGKTSLLRIISGLMAPGKGRISVNGNIWLDTETEIDLPPQKRSVGMVFQDYALFPNMTVRENLLYGKEASRDNKIVDELIEIIELGDLRHRRPQTLSGGQRQRVALARSLVRRPEILLLDEPLSALDRNMRAKLQQYLLKVHREFGLTTILVSHDVQEILKLSDHIIELSHGNIIREGKPADIFSHHQVSGKFQFTGEILSIEKKDIVYILSILIGNELVKVIADEEEIHNLHIGDTVMVASKAFNPVIQKIE